MKFVKKISITDDSRNKSGPFDPRKVLMCWWNICINLTTRWTSDVSLDPPWKMWSVGKNWQLDDQISNLWFQICDVSKTKKCQNCTDVSVVLLPIALSITLEVGTMVKLYAFHQQQLETFFKIFVILQRFLEENYQQTSLWITSMGKLTRNYPKLYLHLQSERKRKAERSMFYQLLNKVPV